MRIAIVGTGISGLVCARQLHEDHELTVFESNDRLGGHTNTIDVDDPSGPVAVDTGFIVFNPAHYPIFSGLLDELGVKSHTTDMSFGVRCERTNFEWAGRGLGSLFAQRRNVFRPGPWRLLRDILRFFREAKRDRESYDVTLSIGAYLERERYSDEFAEYFLKPMAAALWSSPLGDIRDYSIRFVVDFFHNHGMLELGGPKTWRVVTGGSKSYIPPLVEPFRDRIRTSSPVTSVRRTADGVEIEAQGRREPFDHVVLACHADQSLRLVESPTATESELLSNFPYRANHAVLHTDPSVMPRARAAWASWNYRIPNADSTHVTTTYDQNLLQGLRTTERYFVTLDDTVSIDPSRIVKEIEYTHPVFSASRVAAQKRRDELTNHERISYCGAYWGYGFHEDGARSGVEVARAIAAAAGEPARMGASRTD